MPSDANDSDHSDRACRETPKRGRGHRGQSALTKLTSTNDFTHKRRLSLADRKLILFLTVKLAGDHGSLTPAYRAVLDQWSHVEGHWVYGKTPNKMYSCGGKYLGKSAERRPPWNKIEDLVWAALGEHEAPGVLAEAAGLYCQAAGVPEPKDDYPGEIRLPAWALDEVGLVTVEMIHGTEVPVQPAEQAPTEDSPTAEHQPARDTEVSDPKDLAAENALLRTTLDTVLRAFRLTERTVEQLWSEKREILAERDKLRLQNQQLRRHNNALMRTAPGARLDRRRPVEALAGSDLGLLFAVGGGFDVGAGAAVDGVGEGKGPAGG